MTALSDHGAIPHLRVDICLRQAIGADMEGRLASGDVGEQAARTVLADLVQMLDTSKF